MINTASQFCAAGALLIGCLIINTAQASDFMREGSRTAQPVGHYEFCQRMPAECRSQQQASPIALSRDAWTLISAINEEVNNSIIAITDQELWGIQEYWSYPDRIGDCEDYVLEKRRRMMQAGIAAANLLIRVVRQTNGDGHAVLTIRTDRGDLVLDNLTDRILPWSATDYAFLKRQSAQHAGQWIDIDDARSPSVSSVSSTRQQSSSPWR
jgi:predicted transglutaminase-like cysteine proteinase